MVPEGAVVVPVHAVTQGMGPTWGLSLSAGHRQVSREDGRANRPRAMGPVSGACSAGA